MHTALKETSSPHKSSSHPFTIKTNIDDMLKRCFFIERCLLHMAASFECKIATLISIRLSVKPFSVVVEKQTQLACVVSAVPWCLGNARREKNSNTSQLVKCKTSKYLYISTNYCLFDKESN